jgi:hypothetical protein
VTRELVFRVLPDDVRQFEAGHAFVIAGGRAARVRILRLELPEGIDAGAIPPPDPSSAIRKAGRNTAGGGHLSMNPLSY